MLTHQLLSLISSSGFQHLGMTGNGNEGGLRALTITLASFI